MSKKSVHSDDSTSTVKGPSEVATDIHNITSPVYQQSNRSHSSLMKEYLARLDAKDKKEDVCERRSWSLAKTKSEIALSQGRPTSQPPPVAHQRVHTVPQFELLKVLPLFKPTQQDSQHPEPWIHKEGPLVLSSDRRSADMVVHDPSQSIVVSPQTRSRSFHRVVHIDRGIQGESPAKARCGTIKPLPSVVENSELSTSCLPTCLVAGKNRRGMNLQSRDRRSKH